MINHNRTLLWRFGVDVVGVNCRRTCNSRSGCRCRWTSPLPFIILEFLIIMSARLVGMISVPKNKKQIIMQTTGIITFRVVPDLTISNLTGAGPGRTRFLDHRIHLRLVAWAMQYSWVLHYFVTSLPVFDNICGTAMNFVLFIQVTLIKTANSSLDRSAVLVLC